MHLNCEMNAFSENPLFLFVDDLVDDNSSNFANDGKIVELFDTGCDARTPGAALKCRQKLDTPIQLVSETTKEDISTPRKSSIENSFSRQSHTVVKKAADPSALGEAKRNITVTRKSSNENKLLTWNYKKGNESLKSSGNEAKTDDDNLVHEYSSSVKASGSLKQGGLSPEERKAKPSSNRLWLSAKYNGSNRAVKSTEPQKYNETPKERVTTRGTFEGKSGSTRSATNPRTISPPKVAKVISKASLDHGIKKLVNRAVDKDSLSNCSRQFEVRKTSGASLYSKSGRVSRLPRSLRTAKIFSREKSDSVAYNSNGNGEETLANSQSETTTIKTVAIAKQELQVADPESTKATDASIKMPNNDRETESSTKTQHSVNLGSKNSSTRIAVPITRAPSSTKVKITASKMPLFKLNKNSLTDGKVEPSKSSGESKANESVGQTSKLNGKVSSKISITDDATLPQDSGDKRIDGRLKKSSASPSLESCNSFPCKNDPKNESTSLKTKLPGRRTPLIVPKLMNQFRLLENRQNEVSKCSSRDLPVFDPPLSAVVGAAKAKIESLMKPCSSAEVLSKEISERLSRFSSHLQEALDSGIALPSSATESEEVERRDVRDERSKPKQEKNVKINAKPRFVDRKSALKSRATPQSSISLSGACKIEESKSKSSKIVKTLATRNPVAAPSAESKVPRPVAAKRIPRKEITPLQSSSTARTYPQRQFHQGISKNSEKVEAKKDVGPSSLPIAKPAESCNAESVKSSETTSASLEEDSDEEEIPIMSPALCHLYSISPRDEKSENLNNILPQKTIRCRGKPESWIDGHEQAYLKGRAIGLKVASMARAAKKTTKRELIKTSAKINAEKSRPNKLQEIVEIGVSLIEKVIAEKQSKCYSSPIGGDQPSNYPDCHENSNWNSEQWFM